MKNIKLIAFLSLALVSAFVISACTGSTATKTEKAESSDPSTTAAEKAETRGTKVGNLAPEFKLASVKGEAVSLDSLKGNPAVLVFWSYYCTSCEEEAPHINKLNAEFARKGVQVVGINIGESEARTQSGIKDWSIEYTVARDEGRKVTQKYGVIGTPTVIFLDKDGVIKYNGNELPKDYSEKLNSLVS